MFLDLADAVESFKERGYTHIYELGDHQITCRDLHVSYDLEDIKIIDSYIYDIGTDPGSEATVFALRSISGIKGILIISYGMYADPNKAKMIDMLLSQVQNIPKPV